MIHMIQKYDINVHQKFLRYQVDDIAPIDTL